MDQVRIIKIPEVFRLKNLRDNFYPYVPVGVAHRYIYFAPSGLKIQIFDLMTECRCCEF